MIKLVKLSSGEQIIGDVVIGNGLIAVDKPVSLMITPEGMAMVPWPMGAKHQKVDILNGYVLCIVEVDTEITNAYNQQYGSGLVIPNKTVVTR